MGQSDGMEMSPNSVSAAYLTIANAGAAADRLVSAATDVAGLVEIHTSEMDSQGVMRMRPLTDGLEIPPNGSVSLEPGGYHIMLMELNQPLMPGETVTLTLKFASGTTLDVEAEIRLP
jgi:copper(I)-binding protein